MNPYKDKEGHWTSKDNDGGECHHEEGKETKPEQFDEDEEETDVKIDDLRAKARKAGVKELIDLGYTRESGQEWDRFRQAKRNQLLKAGFTDEEVEALEDHYKAQRERKKDYLKDKFTREAERENDYFYGEGNHMMKSNQYFKYKSVIDDDNIILRSNNVDFWRNKGTYVLWVGNDKVVYLKPFNLRQYKQRDGGGGYLVKIKRQYYKPYKTYTSETRSFDKDMTFDDLAKIAKEQEEANILVSTKGSFIYKGE